MKIPRLPTEIMDEIVLYTGDPHVANVLKDKISQYVLDRIEKNILIYGNVQGGKTSEIINYINENKWCQKVLVIQNSLLVLKQYEQRLKSKNIDYQITLDNYVDVFNVSNIEEFGDQTNYFYIAASKVRTETVETDSNNDGKFESASWETNVDFDKDGKADWMEVVNILKKNGWTWGGDWKSFKDAPHFEKTFGHTWKTLLPKHNSKKFIPGTTYVQL